MALSDANLIPDAEQWAFEHRDDDVDSADALIDQLIMDDNVGGFRHKFIVHLYFLVFKYGKRFFIFQRTTY